MSGTNKDHPILPAAQQVMARAACVNVSKEAASALAEEIAGAMGGKNQSDSGSWIDSVPPSVRRHLQSLSFSQRCLFLCIFHAAGFSYWQNPPWTVADKNDNDTIYNGASAWLICLSRNQSLLQPETLKALTEAQWQTITAGENSVAMPMAHERLQILQQLGTMLNSKNSPELEQLRMLLIERESAADALDTAIWLGEHLPGFNDTSTYDELTVPFLKRAQLLVNDLNFLRLQEGLRPFASIDRLTAFADYKIPQILRHKNVLRYSTELEQIVDKQIELQPGSKPEIEIRAATIVAVEAIKTSLQAGGINLSAAELDNKLWLAAQNSDGQSGKMGPYHRCRTTNY
ncbi:MAG: hypothetical protein JSS83_16665 [Cyanobacteria bacterium SZAS LIN-3]|nr:hypothetical protein [Cyanobacteria bacterium SZAS LIN-3]